MSIKTRTPLLIAAVFALLAAIVVSPAQAEETAEITRDQDQAGLTQVEDSHRWGD